MRYFLADRQCHKGSRTTQPCSSQVRARIQAVLYLEVGFHNPCSIGGKKSIAELGGTWTDQTTRRANRLGSGVFISLLSNKQYMLL
jgi:hypothetical protein